MAMWKGIVALKSVSSILVLTLTLLAKCSVACPPPHHTCKATCNLGLQVQQDQGPGPDSGLQTLDLGLVLDLHPDFIRLFQV